MSTATPSMEDRDGKIWMDGKMVEWRDAKIHVLTHTLHYGCGAFEGVRAYKTVNGTAIFLAVTTDGVPAALLHNLKHNQVLHDRVIILTVKFEETPYVEAKDRIETKSAGHGFYYVVLRYGFMEDVDVPRDLQLDATSGGPIDPMRTSYFLGRQKLIASQEMPGMALWREHLFAWMLKTSESAMDFFKLPINRVVELGSQLRI